MFFGDSRAVLLYLQGNPFAGHIIAWKEKGGESGAGLCSEELGFGSEQNILVSDRPGHRIRIFHTQFDQHTIGIFRM